VCEKSRDGCGCRGPRSASALLQPRCGRVLACGARSTAALQCPAPRLGVGVVGAGRDRGRRDIRRPMVRPQPLPVLAPRATRAAAVCSSTRPPADSDAPRRRACSRCRIRCVRSAGMTTGAALRGDHPHSRCQKVSGGARTREQGRRRWTRVGAENRAAAAASNSRRAAEGFVKRGQVLSTRTTSSRSRPRRAGHVCRNKCGGARDGSPRCSGGDSRQGSEVSAGSTGSGARVDRPRGPGATARWRARRGQGAATHGIGESGGVEPVGDSGAGARGRAAHELGSEYRVDDS